MSNVSKCCVVSAIKQVALSRPFLVILLLAGAALVAIGVSLSIAAMCYTGVALLALAVVCALCRYRHHKSQAKLFAKAEDGIKCGSAKRVSPDNMSPDMRKQLAMQCLTRDGSWQLFDGVEGAKYFVNDLLGFLSNLTDDECAKINVSNLIIEYRASGWDGELRHLSDEHRNTLEPGLQQRIQHLADQISKMDDRCYPSSGELKELKEYIVVLSAQGRDTVLKACITKKWFLELFGSCNETDGNLIEFFENLSDEDFKLIPAKALLKEYKRNKFDGCFKYCKSERQSQLPEKIQGILLEEAKQSVNACGWLLKSHMDHLSNNDYRRQVFVDCIGTQGGLRMLKECNISLSEVFAQLSEQDFANIDWDKHLRDITREDLDAFDTSKAPFSDLKVEFIKYEQDLIIDRATLLSSLNYPGPDQHDELKGYVRVLSKELSDPILKACVEKKWFLELFESCDDTDGNLIEFLKNLSDDDFGRIPDKALLNEYKRNQFAGCFKCWNEIRQEQLQEKIQGILLKEAKKCVNDGGCGLESHMSFLSNNDYRRQVFVDCIGTQGGLRMLKRCNIPLSEVFTQLSEEEFASIDWKKHLGSITLKDLDNCDTSTAPFSVVREKIEEYEQEKVRSMFTRHSLPAFSS